MVAGGAGNIAIAAQDLVEEQQTAELDLVRIGGALLVIVGISDRRRRWFFRRAFGHRRLGRGRGHHDEGGAAKQDGFQQRHAMGAAQHDKSPSFVSAGTTRRCLSGG